MKRLNIVKTRTTFHNSFMPIGSWYGRYEYVRNNTARHIDYYISDFDTMTVNVWHYTDVPSRGLRWDEKHKAHCVTRYARTWDWETCDLKIMPVEFQKFIAGMVSRLQPHGVCVPWVERSGKFADVPRERKLNVFDNSIHYVGR